LLSGKVGDGFLELLKVGWGLDALDGGLGLHAFHTKLDLDIDVGVVSGVLPLNGHVVSCFVLFRF